MADLAPVKLLPAFKDYLWGGTKLKTVFNKKTDMETVAESWELSAHPDGESIIAGGKYGGFTLSGYIAAEGREILGSRAAAFDFFPILIKLIDAKENLSVQVHPDDEYALRNEGGYGKTEMWYILDCEPGAFLYYGFCKSITKQEFREAVNKGTLTEILNRVPVHKGDVFFIPAGTVHAIGAGILICEIQQNSNTTYRVYDYGRRDKNGNTRPLHIGKAIDVSVLEKAPDCERQHDGSGILAQCKYFTVREITADGAVTIDIDDSSFRSVIIIEGGGTLNINGDSVDFVKGDSIFIPAQNDRVTLNGGFTAIISQV